MPPLHCRLLAEGLGTLLLLATVVGSGIMGSALSGGNRRSNESNTMASLATSQCSSWRSRRP